MTDKQFLSPEQIQRIVSGEREVTIPISVNLTRSELEAFCSLLRLSKGYQDAKGSLVNYPEFEKIHGVSATRSLMDTVGYLETVFCATSKGMTVDAYITEFGDD